VGALHFFLSALGALFREAQRLGVGGYMKKPYLLNQIGIAVRAELDKGLRNMSESHGSWN
jgi:hypothetical protein